MTCAPWIAIAADEPDACRSRTVSSSPRRPRAPTGGGASFAGAGALGAGAVFVWTQATRPETPIAALGPLPGHGLLRTATWDVAEVSRDPSGAVFALFRTRDTEEMRAVWPHPFRASLRVTLEEALSTALTIENTGQEPFPFHAALHTYLRVGDLRQVTVAGLEGARYQDRTAKSVERRERRRPVAIRGETDRIYMARPDRLRIRDESRQRTILLDRAGFNDVVLWNPGEEKARSKSGLADGEYLTMLAVESAQIVPPVQLAAGSLWSGVQRLRVS